MIHNYYLFLIFIAYSWSNFAQTSIEAKVVIEQKQLVSYKIDPLAPARAAFYSAVIPGLGQARNKKYWKIPIVYGAIGTGIYFYLDNNKVYKRYRNAYKRRLAGFTDDEFYGLNSTPILSNEALIRAQETLRRNKELSLLITIGLYALNIIDANVDAHLLQYNMDTNLAVKPYLDFDTPDNSVQLGLSLNIKF
ncbi:DUF5683 domain-containing protein [Flavobacteriaceae bacterium]|nr:DUF5683 domain-containing protein [Flavobacteriaceae bacterium]MDA9029483.1 DUF5683 domain-containing protein [Flavobacteriaceae bacterium]